MGLKVIEKSTQKEHSEDFIIKIKIFILYKNLKIQRHRELFLTVHSLMFLNITF